MEYKDWFHKILFLLFDNNAFNNSYIDIGHLVKTEWDRFPQSEKDNELNRITMGAGRIWDVRYAEFEPPVQFGSMFGGRTLTGAAGEIRARLTTQGFTYVLSVRREHERHSSLLRTNESIRQTNKNSWIFPALAAVFALLTLVKELWPKSEPKLPQIEEQLKQQKKALDGIATSLREKHFEVSIKDSLKFSHSK